MTDEEGRQRASQIARRFGNLRCEDCIREIIKSLGREFPATIERLHTSDESDVIALSSNEEVISVAGAHLGIGIGGVIIDNHHPDGVPDGQWPEKFKAVTRAPLMRTSAPTSQFFSRIFLAKKFRHWSSRT